MKKNGSKKKRFFDPARRKTKITAFTAEYCVEDAFWPDNEAGWKTSRLNAKAFW